MELDENIVAKMNIERQNFDSIINYIDFVVDNTSERTNTIQLVRDYEYELYNLKLQISDLKSAYRKLKIEPLRLNAAKDYNDYQISNAKTIIPVIDIYYMSLLKNFRDYIIEEKVKTDEEKEGGDIELQ